MDICTKLNYTPIPITDLKKISEDYFKECQNAANGASSSLPFYNSLVRYNFSEEFKFRKVLVMDIGGSHLRLAWMNDGNLEVLNDIKVHLIKGFSGSITEFISFVGDKISGYLDEIQIDCEAIGIAFSFDFDAIKNGENIDIDRSDTHYSDNWKKGYTVIDSDINLSKKLREYLKQKKNISFKRWLGVNDVNALHLSQRDALCAVIVGTGYNVSVTGTDTYMFNTESKNFYSDSVYLNVPYPVEDVLKDIHSRDIARYDVQKIAINEMQVAAYHMPDIFLKALERLDILDDRVIRSVHKLKAEIISLFFSFDIDTVNQRLGYKIEENAFSTYKIISEAMMKRSASLVAAELAGAMKFSRQSLSTDKSIVVADGAIFQKTIGYRELVRSIMIDVSGDDSVIIKCVDDSGLKGAGVSLFTKIS